MFMAFDSVVLFLEMHSEIWNHDQKYLELTFNINVKKTKDKFNEWLFSS